MRIKKPKKLVLIVLSSFILLAAIAAWWVSARFGSTVRGSIESVNTLNEVSQITKLSFPNGAVLSNAEKRGGSQSYLTAKILLSHKDVSNFLAQPPFRGLSFTDSAEMKRVKDVFNGDPDVVNKGWGNISVHRGLAVYRALTPQGQQVTILIDLDNPRVAVLYLHYLA